MTSSIMYMRDVPLTGPAAQSAINVNLLTGNVSDWYDVSDYQSAVITLIGSAGISAGAVTFEQTNDLVLHPSGFSCRYSPLSSTSALQSTGSLAVAASTIIVNELGLKCKYFRARISTAFVGGTVQAHMLLSNRPSKTELTGIIAAGNVNEGTAVTGSPVSVSGIIRTAVLNLASGVAARLSMATNGALIQKPFSIPEGDWQYASASGGIINATPVAVKAAAAAGIRNYVTGFDIKNVSAVATEFLILDNVTPIWRGYLPANMSAADEITFATPLKGTAATALNVQCVTTGAAVYVNMQGYTAP